MKNPPTNQADGSGTLTEANGSPAKKRTAPRKAAIKMPAAQARALKMKPPDKASAKPSAMATPEAGTSAILDSSETSEILWK